MRRADLHSSSDDEMFIKMSIEQNMNLKKYTVIDKFVEPRVHTNKSMTRHESV